MKPIRVAINGLGRIGRLVFRALHEREHEFEVVLINDIVPAGDLAYLLHYDSVHGRWNKKIEVEHNTLIIDQIRADVVSIKDPKDLPHAKYNIDLVIESSGLFTTLEKANGHIEAGAKRVVVTAPSSDIPMFVIGVNEDKYDSKKHRIVANASCTTNCLAPLAKVVHEHFGIVEGLMTTVHAVTATQKTADGPSHRDRRGGRSILNNIIPSSTGAAKAVGKVLPELEGKLTGMAFRVPVSDVSVVDLTLRLKKPTSIDEISRVIKEASQTTMKKILGYTEEPVVSTDFIGSPYSAIYDREASIELNSTFFKLVAWYDNEWGYSLRVVDLIRHMHRQEMGVHCG